MSVAFSAEAVSETDIMLRFEIPPSASSIQQLSALQTQLSAQLAHRLIDSVLAYQSLLLCFSPADPYSPAQRITLVNHLVKNLLAASNFTQLTSRTIKLPVYYGSETGVDFEAVCERTNLTAHELIALHSSQAYHVYALGFSPGFAFLGELPPALHLPRRSTPRLSLPAGSVANCTQPNRRIPPTKPWGLAPHWPLPHAAVRCSKTSSRSIFYRSHGNL